MDAWTIGAPGQGVDSDSRPVGTTSDGGSQMLGDKVGVLTGR